MKLILTALVLITSVAAQTPAFEVASIKPVELGGGRGGRGGRGGDFRPKIDGARVELPFINMEDLLPYAFRAKLHQIVMPASARMSFWAISAKIPDGAKTEQAPEMMQALLAERFKMTFHREKRERPVYTLAVADGGVKMAVAPEGEYQAWDGSFPGFGFRGPLQSGAAITGRITPAAGCMKRYEFVPLPMDAFADALTMFLNRPVVDETHLQGKYKVTLDLTPEAQAGTMQNMMAGRGAPPPVGRGGGMGGMRGPGGGGDVPREAGSCPEPFELMAEGVASPDKAVMKAISALGLKLVDGKAPIDTVIIDHLEKTPTQN